MFLLIGSEQKFDRLDKLADVIRGMTPTELQALSQVLHAERSTQKAGWRFMQKVYVRYAGSANRNYLSNFLIGYVLYADKEYVRIGGDSGRVFLTVINEPNGNTVYTTKRFKELREKMVAEKKYLDNESSSSRSYIAQLDDVAKEPMRKEVKKSKASEDDLVSIVSRMSRGLIGRSSKNKKSSPSSVKEGAEITFHY